MSERQGFTLIELVVVIMILGILAAVAAPKLLNTSGTATDVSVKQTLAIVRDAIELYAADNGGNLPGQGADLPGDLAPYLRGAFPICPVGAKVNTVTYNTGPIAGEASPIAGWKFAYDTGEFICNYDAATSSDPGINYDEL